MGGGTPIGMLRKDVREKIAMKRPNTNNVNYDVDQRQRDEDAIDDLINQLNTDTEDSIPRKKLNKSKKKKSNKNKDDDDEDDKYDDEYDKYDDEKTDKKRDFKKSKFRLPFTIPFTIPKFIQDPLLIWVIFILLSQNFIKQLIGKYVHQINPNEEGVVSFMGVAVYGLIFAVIFGLIKFLLNIIF